MNTTSMLPVGFVLHNTYRIECHLASGGFGNTYKAVNQTNGKYVAIKEFFMKGVTERDETTSSVNVSNIDNYDKFSQQKAKFRKESQRLRMFDNPHVVSVHESFEENGTAYYVMEFIDGESLSARMKRTGLALTEQEVHNILPQILDALKTIHSEGLWHLDIKPGNIMIDKSGTVKLIDFGASKQFDATTGGATAKTKQTYTSGYAPREQMEENYSAYGPWTDIYALGATLYALLTKKHPPLPLDIDDDKTPDKHVALPFPNGVSNEMRNMIVKMMNPNRRLRPQSVDAIIGTSSNANNNVSEETQFSRPTNNEQTRFSSRVNEETVYSQQRYESTNTSAPQYVKSNNSSSNNTALYVVIALLSGVLLTVVLFNLRSCNTPVRQNDGGGIDSLVADTLLDDEAYADTMALDSGSYDIEADSVSYYEEPSEIMVDPETLETGWIKEEGGRTNIRNAPNGDVIMKIYDGSEIRYEVYNSDWYIVYDTSGRRLGFVHSSKID